LNKFLYDNRNYFGLDFTDRIVEFFKIEPRIEHVERLPSKGRYIIAANHPLGGMDGIALMNTVGKVRKDIIFPVNDILLNIPTLYELFIPINKHGSNTENVKIINDTFASDALLLYFPAGLVSRKQSGIIKDLEWKKTFLTRAKRFKRNIIPVFIGGRNTNFFYNLANLRKRLKIKANIEMLYLVDEMVKLRNKNFEIIFGKEIPYTTFDKRFTDQEWAQLLKEHVYNLQENPDEEFEYSKLN
jgi:putative hemolysin